MLGALWFGGGVDRTRRKELLQAAADNHASAVREFLEERGLIEEVKNEQGQNMLHVAALHGSEEVLDLLLEQPRLTARLNSRDRSGRTPLHLAGAMGFTECLRRLVDARGAINAQDRDGSTALLLTIRFEWLDAARLLMENGADPRIADFQGLSALDAAGCHKDKAMAETLAGLMQHRQFFEATAREPSKSRRRGASAGTFQGVIGTEEVELQDLEQGLEMDAQDNGGPVLLPRHRRASDALGTETKAVSTNSTSWWRKYTAGDEQAGHPASAHLELVTFQLQCHFDKNVGRLEFEVAWKEIPCVSVVKPGGIADSRGLAPGDLLLEIAGVQTAGKGRDELLPLLKSRPLFIKVERKERARHNACLELTLHLEGRDAGLEVDTGAAPTVSRVRNQSGGWAAGVMPGDVLLKANHQSLLHMSPAALASSLKVRPLTLLVQRRPLGSEASVYRPTTEAPKVPARRVGGYL